jgi:hypothetical protein
VRVAVATQATATPELALVLSGPVSGTILTPDGRTIAYDEATDTYVSQVPGVIARRGVRHGNLNDPGGQFAPVDVIEIPNAATGSYAVFLNSQGTGVGGVMAEASLPGVRVTDAIQQFSITIGDSKLCHVTYDAAGGAAIAMTGVTGVAEGEAPRETRVRVAPNPINTRALISFDAELGGLTKVDVMDIQGRRVALVFDGVLAGGRQVLEWRPKGRSQSIRPGIYFIRLAMRGEAQVTRVVVVGE